MCLLFSYDFMMIRVVIFVESCWFVCVFFIKYLIFAQIQIRTFFVTICQIVTIFEIDKKSICLTFLLTISLPFFVFREARHSGWMFFLSYGIAGGGGGEMICNCAKECKIKQTIQADYSGLLEKGNRIVTKFLRKEDPVILNLINIKKDEK